jgi:serine protease AprX
VTRSIRILSLLLGSAGLVLAASSPGLSVDTPSLIKKAVAEGRIAYKLTEPDEIIALLGKPAESKERPDGGMLILELKWPGISATFEKFKGESVPYTLFDVSLGGRSLDIGRDRPVVLRTVDDLRKIDRFFGLQGVCLSRLDLRNEKAALDKLSFDTRTAWPPAARLPDGFDPPALLGRHQNPGLGVRALHSRGIDGRGVGAAIIDQPLLLGHKEYSSRIIRYDATGLGDMPPQMHGSPVASILVGQTVGVAPGASLTYFAVPMWKRDNRPYEEALRKVLELNRQLPPEERIRVVSLSTGLFSANPHYEEWKAALAEAEESGILVVTCDPGELKYGILACRPGRNPDDSESYIPSAYASPEDALLAPGAGRTLASFRGDDVYMLDRSGGMSWGAPYIAGLGALAFQVAPGIAPRRVIQIMVETAKTTAAGPVIDPAGFIAAVEKEKERRGR